nr:hypothetical protein [Providencia rettgeri]
MVEIGCVKYLGETKINGKGHATSQYQVTPYAITKLKRSIEKERQEKERQQAIKAKAKIKSKPPTKIKKVVEIKTQEPDLGCGYKVVKKANVKGMGISYLNGLDQMLAEVRQWKTKCQKSINANAVVKICTYKRLNIALGFTFIATAVERKALQ